MVPKKVHQVWVGSNPMTRQFKQNCRTVKEIFTKAGYEYTLWEDSNVPKLPKLCNEVYIKYGEMNQPGLQADIMKWFIINKYGGLYLDTDVVAKSTFHELLTHPFFCISEHPELYWVGAWLFAGEPENQILTPMLEELEPPEAANSIVNKHGPFLLTKYVSNFLKIKWGTNIYKHLLYNNNTYVKCAPRELGGGPSPYVTHQWAHTWDPKKINPS